MELSTKVKKSLWESLIFSGTCRGKKVAIKVPKRKLGPRQIEQFKSEIAMMSKIYHPKYSCFFYPCTKIVFLF
jgi:hypothetical protein